SQASTWVTVSSSANPLASGQPVTFVANVSPYAPGSAGAGYPSGTVTFYDNFNNVSTALGTVTVNTSVGVTSAAITTSTLAAGSHSITARYNGDSNFIACSSKTLTLTVAQPVPLVQAPSNQSQAPSNQNTSEGTAASFNLGSFSEAGSGPWTATVAWGDGSTPTTFNPSAQGALGTQGHIYAQEGTYTVTVTVTDTGANTSGSALFPVSVSDWQLVAAPAPISPTTGAPFSGPVATFTDPGGAEALDGTHYSATINWGDGSATSTGSISLNGSTFSVNGTHTYAAANSYSITVTLIHDGWLYTYVQSSATVTDLGQFVSAGFVKSTSFWEGLLGQGLIRRFGVTSSNQTLGQWLATTFPNLYGGVNGAPNLSIFTNYQVGSYYQSQFLASQGTGLDVEILDTALDLFTTTSSLGGFIGQSYGFTVNSYGLGAYSWNIGSSGAAFGTPNNTVLNVFQILLAANNNAVSGEPWGSNTLLRNEASTVFQGINAA
ncbi:MAG TPA: Ig-like domain-containing protein, partial [Gemmataceae bacterium]|nr:Ig-like domain-containing protein [Gemmataceae bacterium]